VRRGLFAAEAVKLLQDFYSAGNPLGKLFGVRSKLETAVSIV
jgi:hypothetical protein